MGQMAIFPIENCKVTIFPEKKIGAGRWGTVYVGRLKPKKGRSIQVAVKVFHDADIGDKPGWSESLKTFTLFPGLAPSVTIEHYRNAINALESLREKYGGKAIIPRQAILDGHDDADHPMLRRPHIVSALFLAPGKKIYRIQGAASKEANLPYSKQMNNTYANATKGLGKEAAKLALEITLDLAEKGIPVYGDLFGIMRFRKGKRLVVRDPDFLAYGLRRAEESHEPWRRLGEEIGQWVQSLPKKEKEEAIGLLTNRKNTLPAHIWRIFKEEGCLR